MVFVSSQIPEELLQELRNIAETVPVDPNHQRILLTCILKDDTEYDMAERMFASFMPYMAGLCVALTGPSGQFAKLKGLVERYKGRYLEATPATHPTLYLQESDGSYTFSNFAEARNLSFELAAKMHKTENYDWWSWADVDDVLLEGEELQNVARISQERKVDQVFFTYWYAIHIAEDNTYGADNVEIEHLRERLLRPGMFKWTSRLHEVSVPLDGNYHPRTALYGYEPKEGQNCVWAHLTARSRVVDAMHRNIRILELQRADEVAQGKEDPRTIFYLAKSYFDKANQEPDTATESLQLSELLLQEYLPLSGWAEERSNAWEYRGNIRARQGDHRGAIDCFHMAIKEFGNRHMPFLLLAKEYSLVEDFEQSDFWLDVATKMEEPKARTTIGNPLEIRYLAASLKFNQAMRNQDLKKAIQWMQTRHKFAATPDDDKILADLGELDLRNQAAGWIWNYAKWLKDAGHTDKLRHVVESFPLELGRELFAHHIANEVVEPRTWDKDEICIYASWGAEHFEQWSPKSLDSGIGGSETAVIELAKQFAKNGWKVTVYGDPREDEGIYENVSYRPFYELDWKDQFNILVLWRSPHLLDKDIHAKKLYMDLHDIASQLDWTEERMAKVDKVFFKSNYHRNMLPKLPDSKAQVVSNGVYAN